MLDNQIIGIHEPVNAILYTGLLVAIEFGIGDF